MTHDMADKTTHVDIVQNPDIKSSLTSRSLFI